jgi:hypothetical protein
MKDKNLCKELVLKYLEYQKSLCHSIGILNTPLIYDENFNWQNILTFEF